MDGTREERLYHCQNWRGDVVKLISATGGGQQVEGARYSSYGVPSVIPVNDPDGDGDQDLDDVDFFLDREGVPGSYDIRADLDLDGDVDTADTSLFYSLGGSAFGFGNLSNYGSRKGYAGYEHDGMFDTLAHVRNRALATEEGRWTRRDPLNYVDGANLYGYFSSNPMSGTPAMDMRQRSGTADPGDEFGLNPGFAAPTLVDPVVAPGLPGLPFPSSVPDRRPQKVCPGPGTPTPGDSVEVNGCGASFPPIPDGPWGAGSMFTECCNKHDVCYSSCNCKRYDCDLSLYNCMITACHQHYGNSAVGEFLCNHTFSTQYWIGLRGAGWYFYGDAQEGRCLPIQPLPPYTTKWPPTGLEELFPEVPTEQFLPPENP